MDSTAALRRLYFRRAIHGLRPILSLLVALALIAPKIAAGEEPAEPPAEKPARHAFKVGDFSIKNFHPVERLEVKLEFTVYVEVNDGDETRFAELWENHEHRIRNQIISAVRLIPLAEFDDPTLHALRRRIYLRLRRAVPHLPVDKVFVSDFSYLVD